MNKKLQKSKLPVDLSIQKVLYRELFDTPLREKSKERAISILSSAAKCFSQNGIENTTYEQIAKEAKISRPLIFKYFKDHEEIFQKTVKMIRVDFQKWVVDRVEKAKTAQDKFSVYVFSVFDWISQHPNYAGTLILYFERCRRSRLHLDLNSQFTETGRRRIAALINLGIVTGQSTCKNADSAAEFVQTYITGALISSISDSATQNPSFRLRTVKLCCDLAGFDSSKITLDN